MKIERFPSLACVVGALALGACTPIPRDRMAEVTAPDEGLSSLENKSTAISNLVRADRNTERFTLLPQSDGRPSALVVNAGPDKETTLAQPFSQASLKDDTLKTAPATNSSVNNRYADTITALPVTTFDGLVRRTVLSNPEVKSRWHNMKLARYKRMEVLGDFLPSLDFFATIGTEWVTRPNQADLRLTGRTTRAVLTQNLYDGFRDINNTRQADHNVRGRFFELIDASETIAYESVRAQLDVQRYTKLVELAADNLTVHREIYSMIEERSTSGVSRRVDMEQAGGRVALARSNLATEEANLHDVSARYVRVNGMKPAKLEGGLPSSLSQQMPANLADGLRQVLAQSPIVKAAQENVWAADMGLAAGRAAFLPSVDFKASVASANDASAIAGNTKDSRLAFELNWNLYRGHADQARQDLGEASRQRARALHEGICREVRYNFEQGFADYRKLVEQLPQLDQHRIATDKALQAYRQQFNIGQRTLLDVLDVQNEYFEAERAYHDAEYRLLQAQTRLQQVAGRLLPTLGILPLADQEPAHALPPAGLDELTCDATASEPLKVDREAVLQQALRERPVRPRPAPAPAAR